jgi:hypothetical protein
VFTALSTNDGTNGNNNRVGSANNADFRTWYANGQNGALKQLVFAVEQSIVKGAPLGEVQEPTTATTAAAFDEGGNFIDVRFGPLTRGTCTSTTTITSPTCTSPWTDFGNYNPTTSSRAANGPFGSGQSVNNSTSSLYNILLQRDRNGVQRTGTWVRGALAQ